MCVEPQHGIITALAHTQRCSYMAVPHEPRKSTIFYKTHHSHSKKREKKETRTDRTPAMTMTLRRCACACAWEHFFTLCGRQRLFVWMPVYIRMQTVPRVATNVIYFPYFVPFHPACFFIPLLLLAFSIDFEPNTTDPREIIVALHALAT